MVKKEVKQDNIVEEFEQVFTKFGLSKNSSFIIFETNELDDNGYKRWNLISKGFPYLLETMAVWALNQMTVKRERAMAEELRKR